MTSTSVQPVKITVAGKISDPFFHKCMVCLRYLKQENKHVSVECLQFFETQWEEFLKKTANTNKGVFYNHTGSPLIYLNDGAEYIGDCDKFMTYALHNFAYQDNTNLVIYQKKASDAIKSIINTSRTRKYAYFNFNFGGVDNQVVFELFHEMAPKTVENFIQLCHGFKRDDGEAIGYAGSEVHRIVKGMFIQLGKIKTAKEHKHGVSFHKGEFEDESFEVKHKEIGLLGMCKRNG